MPTRSLVADHLTPTLAYAKLRQAADGRTAFLFESAVGGERWSRYSILGYRPRFELRLDREGWSMHGEVPAGYSIADQGPVFERLRLPAADHAETGPVRFHAGLFGYFAYDMVHLVHKVPPGDRAVWDAHYVPLARLFGGFDLVVFDTMQGTVTLVADHETDLDVLEAALNAPIDFPMLPLPSRVVPAEGEDGPQVDVGDADYRAIVERCREYIAAGDAFQIVPSREFSLEARGTDPLRVYRAARILNPAPYMYLLEMEATAADAEPVSVIGASPETLVRVDRDADGARTLTVRPIAGTRPRGRDEAEDGALERELLGDAKERAEHVMLVDLARNDVGRVSTIGSVELVRSFTIERGSHVMHIVSEVRGQVSPEQPLLAPLAAAFPAGTLTGAPKVRAMQIIRELEAAPRNFYGGAVGYVLPSGEMDLAICIRTAVKKGERFLVRAGGGVVLDSQPQAEADETRNKAKSMLAAIVSSRPRRTDSAG